MDRRLRRAIFCNLGQRGIWSRALVSGALVLLLAGAGFMTLHGSPAGRAAPAGTVVAQAIVTLPAAADATVKSWDDRNFGLDVLEVSYDPANTREEAVLLRFDLAPPAVPIEAVVDSAILELFLDNSAGADPVEVGAYLVTDPWDELAVTWNTLPLTETVGVPAQLNSLQEYKSWDVTSFAQAWQVGGNNGVLLRGPEVFFYRRFFSLEQTANPVPHLVVAYSIPVPTPTWTPTATATATLTPTWTPTPTVTPTVPITPTWTPTPTATAPPTPTSTPTVTPTPLAVPTPTPTPFYLYVPEVCKLYSGSW